MRIDAISNSTALTREMNSLQSSDEKSEGTGFKQFLANSIGEVNQLLNEADKASADVATGKSENIHESMIAFEKAETAMKFLTQVRNKALDAYHEIMRMQV